MAKGRAPDCHCFGQLHSAPAGRTTLIRNAVLAVPALLIVVRGSGPSFDDWVAARSAAELVAIAAGVLAAVTAGYVLNARMEKREHAHAHSHDEELPQLAPGESAPAFELEGVSGQVQSLDSLRSGGRTALLVFVDPGCGPCQELLPDLGRWQSALADRLGIAIISSGSAESNRAIRDTHGLTDVLVQRDFEVATSYGVRGTPTAVVVSPDGTVAAPPAAGVLMVEAVARSTVRSAPALADTAS
jgi:peroxiredoxin